MAAQHFLDEVADHAAEGCNYLLAVDVEMNTVEGYAMASWITGYGDFVMQPDLDTLAGCSPGCRPRRCAWPTSTSTTARGRRLSAADPAPPAERARRARLDRDAATELEFIVFRDTYEHALHKSYRELEPANLYNVDYSLLGTARSRAADPPHPQRDGGRRAWMSRTPRASATSASTR